MHATNELLTPIIFDLDGTLWNSVDTCLDAWNETFKEQGINHVLTRDELKSVLGVPHSQIPNRLFPKDEPKRQEITDEVMEEIGAREIILVKQKGGELYANTERVLRKLAKHRKLYIVSNCQNGYIEAFLHFHFTLQPFFNDFESSGNTGKGKAENIRIIMDRHELSDAIYVGDTVDDMKACEDAGIAFIHAGYGFGKVENPDYQISAISDLIDTDILERIEKKNVGSQPPNFHTRDK